MNKLKQAAYMTLLAATIASCGSKNEQVPGITYSIEQNPNITVNIDGKMYNQHKDSMGNLILTIESNYEVNPCCDETIENKVSETKEKGPGFWEKAEDCLEKMCNYFNSANDPLNYRPPQYNPPKKGGENYVPPPKTRPVVVENPIKKQSKQNYVQPEPAKEPQKKEQCTDCNLNVTY